MDLVPIPSQTAGPFFHLGCTERHSVARLVAADTPGERIRIICRVLDGEGAPVDDAMIELWQADAEGKYHHSEDARWKPPGSAFLGFGRLATDAGGVCAFETVRPGRVPGHGSALQAPHINVSVFARGLLQRLATRIYFAGGPANKEDPILALVPAERRATLMAWSQASSPREWIFDIRLCGERETVFFDV